MSQHLFEDTTFFATAVRGLSLLNFDCKEARTPDTFDQWRTTCGKHVLLSDAIASIMIVKPQHLVVAVCLRLQADKLTILWAHNGTAPPDTWEKNYYDNLIRLFRSETDCKIVLRIVVQSCRPKIVSRIKKFISSIGADGTEAYKKTSDFFNVNMGKRTHQAVRNNLVRRRLLREGQSMSDAFDGLVRALKEAINKDYDLGRLVSLVSMCHALKDTEPRLGPPGPGENRLPIPPAGLLDHQSFSRLCKIGDYEYACMAVLKCISRDLTPLQRQNIHLEQVTPPEPITFNVPRTLGGCLHAWAERHLDYQTVQHFRDVQAEYKKTQSGGRADQDPEIPATQLQHAETTIALKVMEEQQNTGFFGPIEIGVSKACCDWCHTWLLEYAKLLPSDTRPIIYRATHGKRPDNWAMPVNTPSSVKSVIFETIDREISGAVEAAKRHRRKSDTPTIGEQEDVFGLDKGESWNNNSIKSMGDLI